MMATDVEIIKWIAGILEECTSKENDQKLKMGKSSGKIVISPYQKGS